jgi:DNA-binding PadR family transcriptional regulator
LTRRVRERVLYRPDISTRYIDPLHAKELNVLELAILGLLKERSMHGYQLKKRLSETLGPLFPVSYGALYPALKRLKAEGAVEEVFPKAEVRRRKNVYRITPAGQESFDRLVQSFGEREGSNDDNGFRVRLAFFRYLEPETRIGVLERRRAALTDRLAELKQRIASYRERVDAYTLSLMHHGMDATERDILWVDDLIRAERRASRKPRKPRARTRARARATSREGAAS